MVAAISAFWIPNLVMNFIVFPFLPNLDAPVIDFPGIFGSPDIGKVNFGSDPFEAAEKASNASDKA